MTKSYGAATSAWAAGMILTLSLAAVAPPAHAQPAHAQPAHTQPAHTQPDSGEFDLLVLGVNAATLSFSGTQKSASYGATAHIETSGLASLIRRLRYDGTTEGAIVDGQLQPSHYTESADTGRRQSEVVLTYVDAVPHIVAYAPAMAAGPDAVDPATMGGTVDPLTAMFATMRRVDKGAECNLSLDLFDGKRASRLQIGPPVAAGSGVICNGSYTRLQGFTPQEMAKQTRFDFTLTYGPTATGDQMQVVKVICETIYGKVTLKRR